MMTSAPAVPLANRPSRAAVIRSVIFAFLLLYVFLVGVQCMSSGIKGLGKGAMDAYLGADLDPFLALLVGILSTTLVQSSSVTTSLVVGLVGSGQVAVSAAVPIIMGANIGTTVTNTIASLAHANRSGEFKRAFAAATCHDFFNFLSVATLLPLELISRSVFGKGLLETGSGMLAELTVGASGAKYKSPLKASFKAGVKVVKSGLEAVGAEDRLLAILTIIVGVILIFAALALIVRVMRTLVLARVERFVNRFLGSGGMVAIAVGIIATAMVQSSSITTSTLVPLAGAGVVTLAQVFPITLGANIGTTVTALVASMAASGDGAMAARQIALVHLLFNVLGMCIWYVPPRLRLVPLGGANWLASIGARSRKWAVVYVIAIFYAVPALIFFVGRML